MAEPRRDPTGGDSTGRDSTGRELRWGTGRERVILGLVLIAGGAVAVAGSSIYVLWLAGLGTAAAAVGWGILPADGWRRVVAASVATPATWLLLTGTHFLGALVVPYLAWMLARRRPPLAWLTALFPIAASVVAMQLFPGYDGMLQALALMGVVLAGSAWLAAALARGGARRTRS